MCQGCGNELEQIQFLPGQASVQTTERYFGSKQKHQDAVNHQIGISVASDIDRNVLGVAVSDVRRKLTEIRRRSRLVKRVVSK